MYNSTLQPLGVKVGVMNLNRYGEFAQGQGIEAVSIVFFNKVLW